MGQFAKKSNSDAVLGLVREIMGSVFSITNQLLRAGLEEGLVAQMVRALC